MVTAIFNFRIWPGRIVAFSCVNSANPSATAFTVYFPGTKSLNSYDPSFPVVVSTDCPAGVVNKTVAPATVEPDGSITCPRKPPLAPCAAPLCARSELANSDTNINMIPWNCRDFITSPKWFSCVLIPEARNSMPHGLPYGVPYGVPLSPPGAAPRLHGERIEL